MKVLIASSSTGGHIYPALAVAEEITKRDPGAEILFVGTKWEIAKDIVKASGYRQEFIEADGFDRKNPFNNVKVFYGLLKSAGDIKRILKGFSPDVVLGSGGYVSGPVLRVAKKSGYRTMLMEQNVIPGAANKIAEKYADRVFAAFDDTVKYFKKPRNVIVSGNPVRAEFAAAAADRDLLREKYEVPGGAFCVLVFGGSQGAGAMNDAGCRLIESLAGNEGFYTILITGKQLLAPVLERLASGPAANAGGYKVLDYSDTIFELYAAADLIVSRAGALTVTEIAHSGKASVLVPSPNVTNNHQYYNAAFPADAGAAVLLQEGGLEGTGLPDIVTKLAADRPRLEEMGRKAAGLAKPDAARVIADEIFGS